MLISLLRIATESIFRFNCFNLEDSHDLSVGLENGELCIPGRVLKRDVFDPIVAEVLDLIDEQIRKCNNASIDALILVGGFSASEYLFTRVREQYGHRIAVIARPNDCDVATLQGASRYGLGLSAGKVAVASVISPRSYIMRVRLPAEPIDIQNRPAYITNNNVGSLASLATTSANTRVAGGHPSLREQALVPCGGRGDPQEGADPALALLQILQGPARPFFHSGPVCLRERADQPLDGRRRDTRAVSLDGRPVRLAQLSRCRGAWAIIPRVRHCALVLSSCADSGAHRFDLGLILDSAEVRGILLSEDGRECGAASESAQRKHARKVTDDKAQASSTSNRLPFYYDSPHLFSRSVSCSKSLLKVRVFTKECYEEVSVLRLRSSPGPCPTLGVGFVRGLLGVGDGEGEGPNVVRGFVTHAPSSVPIV